MSEITSFLLALIAMLGSANVLLWFNEKRNNDAKPGLETALLGTNNDFFEEITDLKSRQESVYSRINALEEAVLQIQSKVNGRRHLKDTELPPKKKEKLPKSKRVKILEEYLKKI